MNEAVLEMEGRSTPRHRMSDTERSALLREAAEVVFLRHGYTATSMDEVARQAGMSKRTLYQHYASKAELFEAVMRDCLEPLTLPPDDGLDFRAASSALLTTATRHLLAPRQMAIFRIVSSEGPRTRELAEAFHRAGPGHGANAMQTLMQAEIDAGRLRIKDAHAAAKMLYGMVLGPRHMMVMLGLEEVPDEAEIAMMVKRAVDIFLQGALVQAN
ncbi:TetR/AcrR family transcriptional regulator [Rhodovarius crocodyli]|uniref:TetR/AcrR family transcriptional regulator n=1 Tax=Rhodovarius crocodyli TaxID=1979269 RepID=A0A437MEG8_9PROT|nr:TetR/AcrR family transcriptional regulator [Rhodovarius crocodyli]RVT96005.1 TetR/AcrR family transcriptional regulator [Rhodovarius crocodyli]